MRKKEKTRVIWKHPKGRFEVRETEHYSLFEHRTYFTRECVMTPQKDARGLACDVPIEAPKVLFMRAAPRRKERVTDEEAQKFAKLFRSGMSVRSIGIETGRAGDTVANALRRIGFDIEKGTAPAPWTNGQLRKAIRMHKAGATYKEIGLALGKSDSAVRHKLASMGEELVWA